MAKLSTLDKNSARTSVIVYGPPKSGKTELVGSLAETLDHAGITLEGKNLYYVDIENGKETLFKLPADAQERVEIISVYDTKDNPNAIDTVCKLMTGAPVTLCVAHGKANCASCISKKLPVETYEFAKLDPAKDIVVIDSFTQLTSSANAHATRRLDRDKGENEEFSHWRYQGTLLEKFLDLCQNNVFNVVVIAHEMGIEQEEGGEKIMPAGGTKNFARTVSKYFAHIVYCNVVNKSHRAISATTASSKILTGSRTDVDVSANPKFMLKYIFEKTAQKPEATTAKPAATSAKLPATSKPSGLLRKG